jgi:signal transduction histidine kinase
MAAVIRDQERKLEEAAALSGWKEIASFLSHQLKNPLAAVDLSAANARMALERACAGLPASQEPAPEQAILGEALSSIQEETARMKALIGRLKSLTSFEQARFRPESLAALAAEAASRYQPSRARVEISGDVRVSADRDLLVQALVNLMDNSAEEAERAGRSPVSISVEIGERAGRAYIEYSDDNIGLDQETAARLGKERFTTKRTGSGLGLLFVNRILAIHGGGFEAQAGPGGCFSAHLDLGPKTEEEAP